MEKFDLQLSDCSSKNILKILEDYGFVRIPGFVKGNRLNELLSNFESGIAYNNYFYGYGYMSRFEELPKNLDSVKTFFSEPLFMDVAKIFWRGDSNFTKEYSFIHDFKFNPEVIYGYLHFDRRHQLKIMLYLTDVMSDEYGAFCAVPGSNKLGRKLFIESWERALSKKFDDSVNIDEIVQKIPDNDPRYKSLTFRIDHEAFQKEHKLMKEIIPITGLAGTLIIFDTNTLHKGGVIKCDKYRKTIRLHTFLKNDS